MEKFIKRNAASYSDALIREAQGLRLLDDTLRAAGVEGPGAVRVPEVLSVSESELVIPRINPAPATPEKMAALGEGLARMHRLPIDRYGLDADNMIGLSRQKNTLMDHWGKFFLEYRLRPQVSMIADGGVRDEFESTLDACGERVQVFLDEHCDHPSVLHGDLWSGNAIFDRDGPWLIDPAAYYGDREADLAMTHLFGGFSPDFYRAYHAVYPLTAAYERKRPVYNLYHTLNHYNLFGDSYLGACRRNLGAVQQI
ncbi:fructosamine kinase family protein [Marinobacter halotolerans]|uniref:fructosamine kinase family protein n=1 Tax=Marinobacter halotolerans TaxID=1569211 RepID=UPI0012455F3E|nr:fructosamine kinase family protein [Marinobacter halotolerans]